MPTPVAPAFEPTAMLQKPKATTQRRGTARRPGAHQAAVHRGARRRFDMCRASDAHGIGFIACRVAGHALGLREATEQMRTFGASSSARCVNLVEWSQIDLGVNGR